MCGIIGFVGTKNAKEVLRNGLKSMEYRGYDSSGMAINTGDEIEVIKELGSVEEMSQLIEKDSFDGSIGIGHIRWATHGVPSVKNAHPHQSQNKEIAIVHNGIIENYLELKEWLIKEHNINFVSETDSEVIAQLIGVYYEENLFEAVKLAVHKMRGAYAVAVMAQSEPDKLIAVRKDAPLIVGLGDESNFVASDIPAVLKYTRDIYLIENNETIVLTKDDVKIYGEDGNLVDREVYHVTWDADAAEKGGYDHFMIKEIMEQPLAISETINRRIDSEGKIVLDGINLTKKDIEGIDKIYIVACGTAYHAGLTGKALIEKFVKTPVEVDIASEFRYRSPLVDDRTLFIAISQSGETLDTLAALREAKKNGARILSVVNVVGSSVARESDDVFYTWAGPEISVASTKAYTTQLLCMYLLALYMGKECGTISNELYDELIKEILAVPDKIKDILEREKDIKALADKYFEKEKVFFIGRGLDVGTAYEASLKLKEISYINSLAIAAGELKHGSMALLDKDVLVFTIAAQEDLFEKTLANIEEVKARGAEVLGIAKYKNNTIDKKADTVFYIPEARDEIMPLISVVPLQIFAYYMAKNRGTNVDKPRNLAKSVTVE